MKISEILLITLLLISPVVFAQSLDMQAATINLHLAAGNDVNRIILGKGTLLQVASRSGNGELVKSLVEAGADTNLVSDVDDQPPLTLAIRLDDLEILKLLIDNGADVNGMDGQGRTPLFKTLKPDRPAARQFLIDNGADVNKSLNGGVTVIVEAISSRNIGATSQLIASSADIDGKLIAEIVCAPCHGDVGTRVHKSAFTPKLAGQHAEYTVKQLRDYREKARSNHRMDPLSGILFDEINVELAAFYESLPRFKSESTGTAEIKAKGKLVFDQQCSSCHGSNGIDTENNFAPILAGMNSSYVGNQLRNYKTGERANDADSVMRNITAELTREQIFELSEYIQSM